MKQFELHRFATLLKWHLVGNRREILNVFFALTIAFFALSMFFTQVMNSNQGLVDMIGEDGVYAGRVHQAMGVCLFAIAMTVFVGAARIFSNMKTTRQRTTFLMLPASNGEKWLLRFLHATVLLVVLAFAALVVADTVRMLIAPLWGKPLVSGVAWLFGSGDLTLSPSDEKYGPIIFAAFVGVCLLHHAIFVLGGTLFRKQPFLLTSGILFVLFVLSVQLLYKTQWQWINNLTLISYDSRTGLHVSPWIYGGTVAHYVLAVVFYWLSYRVFTRMQVINNKWLNV